jgi:hypothetical protein
MHYEFKSMAMGPARHSQAVAETVVCYSMHSYRVVRKRSLLHEMSI